MLLACSVNQRPAVRFPKLDQVTCLRVEERSEPHRIKQERIANSVFGLPEACSALGLPCEQLEEVVSCGKNSRHEILQHAVDAVILRRRYPLGASLLPCCWSIALCFTFWLVPTA